MIQHRVAEFLTSVNIYETDRLLSEYLLFHYATAEEILPWPEGPRSALDYAVRCVTETFDFSKIPSDARALDIGCAVGRSTFELARHFHEVIGVDYSQRFIQAAQTLADGGELPYSRADEAARSTGLSARIPAGVEKGRARFEVGDAHALRDGLGVFDAVLAANLVDRLREPMRFLRQLPALLKPGGQLVLTSPYTWLEDFTPRENWLSTPTQTTLEHLQATLDPYFELIATRDLPFLIREHARKYQWSVAQASVWIRRP